MAMIRCPECGFEISSKADKCVHCGAPVEPLINNHEVLIYTAFFDNTSFWGVSRAAKMIITSHDKELWSGLAGQSAKMEISFDTEIEVLVKHVYTGHPFPFYRDVKLNFKIQPGKIYNMLVDKISITDPKTKSTYKLEEIE